MKATDLLPRKTYTSMHASNFAGDFQECADMCGIPNSDPPRSEGNTQVCRHSCVTCGAKCKMKMEGPLLKNTKNFLTRRTEH